MQDLKYEFLSRAGRTLNARVTRSLVLTGNINDLFFSTARRAYVPLIDLLTDSWSSAKGTITVVYELNGPIRFVRDTDLKKVRDAWTLMRHGATPDQIVIKRVTASPHEVEALAGLETDFDKKLMGAVGQPTVALEFLRQLCMCSRYVVDGKRVLDDNLIIIIEGADMLIPEGEIARLSEADRHRVAVCHDWFSDPAFLQGQDTVVLISESRSLLNARISRLPQVLDVEIQSPNELERLYFINWFAEQRKDTPVKLWGSVEDLARSTAALSIHALNQLLIEAAYEKRTVQMEDVVSRVEAYIKAQLGEDVVEFKKPTHSFDDCVGFRTLKEFLLKKLLKRFRSNSNSALSGAAVAGPIGGGKTYIFEALASRLDMPVLVLKNLRSMWFGQTDVIWERFRRVIGALSKVLIFMDEADTQLGGVSENVHETERRLTGKIQAMMSDTGLRGRVFWLLMTARIHQLSPDLRRPGRVGDLIIPVLDPEGDDRKEFVEWVLKPVVATPSESLLQRLDENTAGYSAASFASLRGELLAEKEDKGSDLNEDEIVAVMADHLPPPIGETRRYQTLQAMVNCTRRSLLPNPRATDQDRLEWQQEIRKFELMGVR